MPCDSRIFKKSNHPTVARGKDRRWTESRRDKTLYKKEKRCEDHI